MAYGNYRSATRRYPRRISIINLANERYNPSRRRSIALSRNRAAGRPRLSSVRTRGRLWPHRRAR